MSMLNPITRSNPFARSLMFDPFDFFNPIAPREIPSPVMRTDISETEDGFKFAIDLPGFKKEDVSANLKDGYLSITASTESQSEQKDQNGTVLRKERYSGNCRRTFYVGDQIEEDGITAAFEDGVLHIDVPKQKEQPQLEDGRAITIC